MNQSTKNKVDHPSHYTSNPFGLETIEITQYYNFCVGNALKYILRAGLKEEEGYDTIKKQTEDLKKAVWYINKEIENIQKGVYYGKESKKQNKGLEKECCSGKSNCRSKTSGEEAAKFANIDATWLGAASTYTVTSDAGSDVSSNVGEETASARHCVTGSTSSDTIDLSNYGARDTVVSIKTNAAQTAINVDKLDESCYYTMNGGAVW